MLDGAVQDIGDGLDAAVRMPGKAGEIIGRPVVAEIVEQQERIGLRRLAEAEGAAQLDAGALDGGLGLHDAFDGSDGHESVPFSTILSSFRGASEASEPGIQKRNSVHPSGFRVRRFAPSRNDGDFYAAAAAAVAG